MNLALSSVEQVSIKAILFTEVMEFALVNMQGSTKNHLRYWSN